MGDVHIAVKGGILSAQDAQTMASGTHSKSRLAHCARDERVSIGI